MSTISFDTLCHPSYFPPVSWVKVHFLLWDGIFRIVPFDMQKERKMQIEKLVIRTMAKCILLSLVLALWVAGVSFIVLAQAAAGVSFTPATYFAAGNSPVDVAIGDFNADGKQDLAVVDNGYGNVAILFNATPLATYDFIGFFPPVDNLPVFNEVQAGRAIPVKFSLGGDKGLDIFAMGYPKSQEIPCDSTVSINGIEQTVTVGSSSLSYDLGTDQYNYVWKTEKAWAKTCRQLVVKLNDNSVQRANFKFK